MSDITRVLPTTEFLPIAGAVRPVRPLRLFDVAELQGWIKARVPCPLDVHLARDWTDARAKRRALADVYEACEVWPPRYGSDTAAELFATDAGITFFLSVVARRSGWTHDDLADVLAEISPTEYERLSRAAFGVDPVDACATIMRLYDDDDQAEDLNWAKAFAEAIEATGYTFAELGELTLSQWIALRTRGEVDRSVTCPPGMDRAEFARRQRAKFYGEEDPSCP